MTKVYTHKEGAKKKKKEKKKRKKERKKERGGNRDRNLHKTKQLESKSGPNELIHRPFLPPFV